jgi:hypothetical protein
VSGTRPDGFYHEAKNVAGSACRAHTVEGRLMEVFVEQLASLCRQHVTRDKWVFVPSHAIGHTLGERIALGGTNWLNLRFVTPLDVALRMGAPFLVERGIEPSEEGLGPALIMRLMLDLPKQGGYFRPLADQPTLAQALCRASSWPTSSCSSAASTKASPARASASKCRSAARSMPKTTSPSRVGSRRRSSSVAA